ncbi:molybdopterin synthase sulfur carrier subunit [Amylibacter marinus]|uniref:Molybdopterin synthase sulfur carrier subunit n=1 Tax=Amylibacter marinus TaxID=1475483 RepID=A0ABQ5VXW4_9RHOB|nr:molybdopterin converting factor subunit 1 [Amylibacter marinus]GLQ35921.1 molybdopterin synthase sulfur carrier subunit [Amylibacter marinus]
MRLNLVYFAWVRERIDLPSETVETDAKTVAELITELRARDARYDLAFSDTTAVRVAINQELCEFSSALADGQEVAFFPPMTGG